MSPMRAQRRNYTKVMGGQRDPYERAGTEVVPAKHQGCPLHKAIRAAVVEALTTEGFFHKETLLSTQCKLVLGDTEGTVDLSSVDVQWDFIMRSIAEDPEFGGAPGKDENGRPRSIPFLALTSAFFSKTETARREQARQAGDRETVLKIAGRMVGAMNSGKIAGYALVLPDNADLTQAYVHRLRRMTNAVGTGCARVEKEAVRTLTPLEGGLSRPSLAGPEQAETSVGEGGE